MIKTKDVIGLHGRTKYNVFYLPLSTPDKTSLLFYVPDPETIQFTMYTIYNV